MTPSFYPPSSLGVDDIASVCGCGLGREGLCTTWEDRVWALVCIYGHEELLQEEKDGAQQTNEAGSRIVNHRWSNGEAERRREMRMW